MGSGYSGAALRRWVSEHSCHEWTTSGSTPRSSGTCSLTQRRDAAPEYPDPVVDHSERREQALEMFERARGEADSEAD